MGNGTRAVRIGLLTVLAAMAAGCSGTFSANVANQSPHPVRVELAYTSWYGGTKVLEAKRIGPGDVAEFGPTKVPRSHARLLAQPEGIAAPRASVNIPSGQTTAHIVPVTLPSGIEGVKWRRVEGSPN